MKIWILFAALMVSACSRDAKTELFNGKDLTGWVCVVDPANGSDPGETFGVQEGNIRILGTPFGYMRTTQPYEDYTLHVEWRWLGEPSNSGIFQRVQPGDRLWPNAVECQLMAGRAGDLVLLGGATAAGVESVGKFPIKARLDDADCEKAPGEWNQAEIICLGDRITVRINGVLQNECAATNRSGYIALQSEGGPVEFRNIYLIAAE